VYRFRARYVFPVETPPIEDGQVVVHGDHITEVGKYRSGTQAYDLGDVAILPALVNAHTHLEFSNLAAPLAPAGQSLAPWLRSIVSHRRELQNDPDYDPQVTIEQGLAECTLRGTALVGDIATLPWPQEKASRQPIRGTVFRELLGVRADQIESLVQVAIQYVNRARPSRRGWKPGLSPHAPYTTSLELVQRVAQVSAANRVPLAMHLAEAPEEIELLAAHSGPLVELLDELGAWVPEAIPRGIDIRDYLEILSSAQHALVVHGNYLAGCDMDFLASRANSMAVVYCPRTHAYFGHGAYPLAEMLGRGVHLALGTDSRASNPDLDLLGEIRHIAHHHPEVSPQTALGLGTIGGARALGQQRQWGSIAPRKRASLIAIPLLDCQADDPHELLFATAQPAEWIIRDGVLTDFPGRRGDEGTLEADASS
jgi:cytosine/adenosine deaminase-related metal-dependent hydrolase